VSADTIEAKTLSLGSVRASALLRELGDYSRTVDAVAQNLGIFFDLCHEPVVLSEIDGSIAESTGYVLAVYQLHDALLGLLMAARAGNASGYDMKQVFAHGFS
jgi:hypothetical protein